MFIDICFPKDNEEKFIEIAKKSKTNGLLFVYGEKTRAKEIAIPLGCNIIYGTTGRFDKGMQIIALGKKIIVFDPEDKNPITQVHAKEMASSKNLFVFSLSSIRQGNRNTVKRLCLMTSLCRKYKVKTAIACFADLPYGLVPEKELYSLAKSIGMKEADARSSVSNLHEYLYTEPSAIFL